MTICERFFALLDAKDKRPADLCKILNIGTSVTSGWKKRGTDPPAHYIMQISDFLGVTPEYLLTGKDTVPCTSDPYETRLVQMFRELPPSTREFLYDAIQTAYDKEISKRSSRQ